MEAMLKSKCKDDNHFHSFPENGRVYCTECKARLCWLKAEKARCLREINHYGHCKNWWLEKKNQETK